MDLVQRIVTILPAFLLAIILHEVAHAYVAYRCGDDTAKLAGRITLSPLPHIDPLGLLVFVVSVMAGFGFGWAKPVPVNPARFRHPVRDDILVSLAGVTVNLLQALAWAGLLRLVYPYAVGANLASAFVLFCYYAVRINLILMVFNLIPIPPLDGSHVLFHILQVRDPMVLIRLSQLGPVILLLLLWFGALDPVFETTIPPMLEVLVP